MHTKWIDFTCTKYNLFYLAYLIITDLLIASKQFDWLLYMLRLELVFVHHITISCGLFPPGALSLKTDECSIVCVMH